MMRFVCYSDYEEFQERQNTEQAVSSMINPSVEDAAVVASSQRY